MVNTDFIQFEPYKKKHRKLNVQDINEIKQSDTFMLVQQIDYCQRRKKDFKDYKTGETLLTFQDSFKIHEFLSNSEDWYECMKIIKNDSKRFCRLKNRLNYFFKIGYCVFVTLTFTDDVLKNTSYESRRTYVRKWFKANSAYYVANIDFGKTTDREHYHGIMMIDFKKTECIIWQHGFYNIQEIYNDETNGKYVLAHYILKLASHFMKNTVKRNYVIYSRNKFDIDVDYIHANEEPDQLKFEQLKIKKHL